ncbi:hypothetical protein ACRAKI_21190 [Saccharothrix isguenensis]
MVAAHFAVDAVPSRREITAGDGYIGQLPGYHYLWSWTARLIATPEQVSAVEEAGHLFGVVPRWRTQPRDNDLVVVDEGDEFVFTGRALRST